MNILLINHYAGSKEYGMVFRTYYMCREFVRMGHHVSIVAASYSHLRVKNPVVNRDLQDESIDGIRYLWLKTPKYEKSGLGRIKNILTFIWKLRRNASKIESLVKPNLVIASSTYNLEIYTAHSIARKNNAKLCYEIRDLWPLTPLLIGGYSQHHPFIWAVQKAENYAYKYSDKVVSLLWNAEEHCKEHGLKPGKFVCIPNGYDPAEWTDDKFNLPLPEEHNKVFDSLSEKVVIGFAGSFSPSGTIDVLVRAAAKLKGNSNLHFVLVGKGPEKTLYEEIIRKENLENVTILPPVSKFLIPAIDSHFDICFLGGIHSPLHKYGTSPNKLTDYMLCEKPIVHAVDEPGAAVEREQCGIRVEAENVDEVARAITQLANMTADERKIMGARGRKYAETLKWTILANKFINAFVD